MNVFCSLTSAPNYFLELIPILGILLPIAFGLIILVARNLRFLDIKRKAKKYKKEKELKKEGISQPTYDTGLWDDYYPIHRNIETSAEPVPESDFHMKLNYQTLIEGLSRKLFFLFLFIISFSMAFGYYIYLTSTTEAISPVSSVIDGYEKMMNRVISVENTITQQILDDFQIMELPSQERQKIILEHLKSEDEVFTQASNYFFRIYYTRYIIVRLFIATIAFMLINYFIKVYQRLREDRNDLILKEEALSIYFSTIRNIDNNEYSSIKEKMPEFPLNQLLSAPKYSNSKTKGSDELISNVQTMMDKQFQMMAKLIEISKKE